MTFDQYLDKFCFYALQYPDLDIHKLYGKFIRKYPYPEYYKYFYILLQTGEAIRESSETLQNKFKI